MKKYILLMGLMFFLGGSIWPVAAPMPDDKPDYQESTIEAGNDAQLVMDQAYPVSPELLMQETLQPTAAYYMQVLHQLPTASVTKLNLVDPGSCDLPGGTTNRYLFS